MYLLRAPVWQLSQSTTLSWLPSFYAITLKGNVFKLMNPAQGFISVLEIVSGCNVNSRGCIFENNRKVSDDIRIFLDIVIKQFLSRRENSFLDARLFFLV